MVDCICNGRNIHSCEYWGVMEKQEQNFNPIGDTKMKDIVFISSIRWDYAWHRQQEIVTKLSEIGYNVLFVQPNSRGKPSYPEKVLPKVWTFTPWGLPYERCLYSINYINSLISKIEITRAMKQLNMRSPIIMFDRVHGVPAKYYCRNFRTIYDLVDEIVAFGRVKNRKMLIDIENYVLENVGLVTSSSMTLMKRKMHQSNRTGKCIFIPNGVDVERFKGCDTWSAIKNLGKPIVGFVGTISQRSIDYPLVKKVAKYNRKWKFVFVGPGRQEDKDRLLDDNVFVYEQVSGEMIPEVINSFDVAIIPYITKGDLMDYVFPRKACEYLAAGKPVVSTAMKELSMMEPFVQVAHNSEDFICGIERALTENNQEEKRIEFAKRFDWKVILHDFTTEVSDW